MKWACYKYNSVQIQVPLSVDHGGGEEGGGGEKIQIEKSTKKCCATFDFVDETYDEEFDADAYIINTIMIAQLFISTITFILNG